MNLSGWLISLGLTRDSVVWFWGRLTSAALLVVSGLVPLDNYVSPTWHKVVTVSAAIVLWLAGKYDSSPLPGGKK